MHNQSCFILHSSLETHLKNCCAPEALFLILHKYATGELVKSSIFYASITSFILEGYIKNLIEVKLRIFLEKRKRRNFFPDVRNLQYFHSKPPYICGKEGKKSPSGIELYLS